MVCRTFSNRRPIHFRFIWTHLLCTSEITCTSVTIYRQSLTTNSLSHNDSFDQLSSKTYLIKEQLFYRVKARKISTLYFKQVLQKKENQPSSQLYLYRIPKFHLLSTRTIQILTHFFCFWTGREDIKDQGLIELKVVNKMSIHFFNFYPEIT